MCLKSKKNKKNCYFCIIINIIINVCADFVVHWFLPEHLTLLQAAPCFLTCSVVVPLPLLSDSAVTWLTSCKNRACLGFVLPLGWTATILLKWRKLGFSWSTTSSTAPYAWTSWRTLWLFHVDTVIVKAALKATGTRMTIWGSMAVLSAGRASLPDPCWARTQCWLMWWRNWRRPGSTLDWQHLIRPKPNPGMWSVMFALGQKTKPLNPAWSVWRLTARPTFNPTTSLLPSRNTSWFLLQRWCKNSSAVAMINCWRCFAAQISSVFVIFV